jgi:hypothetical protein
MNNDWTKIMKGQQSAFFLQNLFKKSLNNTNATWKHSQGERK